MVWPLTTKSVSFWSWDIIWFAVTKRFLKSIVRMNLTWVWVIALGRPDSGLSWTDPLARCLHHNLLVTHWGKLIALATAAYLLPLPQRPIFCPCHSGLSFALATAAYLLPTCSMPRIRNLSPCVRRCIVSVKSTTSTTDRLMLSLLNLSFRVALGSSLSIQNNLHHQ
jgi:hypothetical protein